MVNRPLGGLKLRRDTFDSQRGFIVVNPIRVAGRVFSYGDAFDNNLVTTRRLRQLFDQRKIDMLPFDAIDPTEGLPSGEHEQIDFSQLPDEAILHWLESSGVVIRLGTSRAKLIARAEKELAKQFDDKPKNTKKSRQKA